MVYSVPRGSPTARLVLRAALQADEQLIVNALDDALACKGSRRVTGGTAKQPPAAAVLAAGKLITLDYAVLKPPRQACLVRWTFTPEAGRSYMLQGMATATGCLALLFDVSQPDQVRPAAGAVRRNVAGQACAPLDQSAAMPSSPLDGGQSGGDAVLNPLATDADLEGLIRP